MLESRFTEYLPLVCELAQKAAKRSAVDYDDLYQEGAIGLMRALKTFDSSKASNKADPFRVFACWKIRSAMRDYCRKARPGSRVFHPIVDSLDRINSYGTDIGANLQASDNDIASNILCDEQSNELHSLLHHLPQVERVVIEDLYFGGLTERVIAHDIKVSESRVSQIKTVALRHLRFRHVVCQYGHKMIMEPDTLLVLVRCQHVYCNDIYCGAPMQYSKEQRCATFTDAAKAHCNACLNLYSVPVVHNG